MKPRKRVLLWCADAEERGRIAFALETAAQRSGLVRIAAMPSPEAVETVAALGCFALDALVVIQRAVSEEAARTAAMLLTVRQTAPRLPTLLAVSYALDRVPAIADVVLERWRMDELMERLRVLVARKRGPQKKAA